MSTIRRNFWSANCHHLQALQRLLPHHALACLINDGQEGAEGYGG